MTLVTVSNRLECDSICRFDLLIFLEERIVMSELIFLRTEEVIIELNTGSSEA